MPKLVNSTPTTNLSSFSGTRSSGARTASPTATTSTTAAAAAAAARPSRPCVEPKVITMNATSSPSSSTPLKATVNDYQSTRAVPASASSASRRSRAKAAASSWSGLKPLARRIALRSHCSPKASSSAPTTRRSVSIGIALSAEPSATTTAASVSNPAPTPRSVDRQPRTTPTASTIVSASTASTALATKVVRKSRTFDGDRGLAELNRHVHGETSIDGKTRVVHGRDESARPRGFVRYRFRREEAMNATTTTPEARFRTVDGVRIRYADSGASQRPVMLLTSPWPESLYAFAPIWDTLAPHARLFAIDLPGFGASESRDDLFSPRAMGEFLARVIAEAELGTPHIVAPDVGTSAALFAAAAHPERIASVVVGTGGAAVPLDLGEPLRSWVLDPDFDKYRAIDPRVIVNTAVDTNASGVPEA